MSTVLPTDRTHDLRGPVPVDAPTGRAPGVNIAPGTDDDGWVVPPPVRLADGTHVQLYKDGQAWHAAFDAMRHARRRICLELYIFASDDTGRAVAELLCRKARDGVRVFVLYDSFGSFNSDPAMFEAMRQAGAHVRVFHPLNPLRCRHSWRPLNRDHRKLLVIDEHLAGLGGMNLGEEYAGSWIVKSKLPAVRPAVSGPNDGGPWRDNAVGLVGPAASCVLESFARTWRYVRHGGHIRRTEFLHNPPGADFGLLASAATTDSPLLPALHRLVRSARASISLTYAYFAPDDLLITELCQAADRGVRIRLMLPGRGDVRLLVIAARSFYDLLMSHGVAVYERQNVMLHAKTMVVDGRTVVIGSANLDYRSIEYNCELSARIDSEPFGRQVEALFDNDVRFAKRIDPDQWKRRPTWDRAGQWVVSRARYLL
jgi:cardiolipin synthase